MPPRLRFLLTTLNSEMLDLIDVFHLFSTKISNLAIQYLPEATTELLIYSVVMFRHSQHTRSWSCLMQKKKSAVTSRLSLTYTYCKHRQDSGCKLQPHVSKSHALYAHNPPRPPPYNSGPVHKCSTFFTQKTLALTIIQNFFTTM